jgi:hypothetical protein
MSTEKTASSSVRFDSQPTTHSGPVSRSGPAVASPGFVTSGIPGMSVKPVAHEVRRKTRDLQAKTPEVWKAFNALARTMRIVNRADRGPLAGKPFCASFNGELYPDEVDGLDESTWLQPGEYMDVPKEVAFHIVGNVWDPNLPDRMNVINRYGGPQYAKPSGGKANPGAAAMQVIGLPRLPDLVVAEVNARGRESSGWIEVFDLYTKGLATILADAETAPEDV